MTANDSPIQPTTPQRRPRVILADDHRLLREMLAQFLKPHCDSVETCGDGRTAVSLARELSPDVVVLDIGMPLLNGLEAARQLRQCAPAVKVILLTVNEDPDLAAEAIEAGASGFILKNSAAAELLDAISTVLQGKTYVTPLAAQGLVERFQRKQRGEADDAQATPRQREVLQLIAEGYTMKEIASTLNIRPRTVAFHKYSMMQELGLHSNAELIAYALKHGISTR